MYTNRWSTAGTKRSSVYKFGRIKSLPYIVISFLWTDLIKICVRISQDREEFSLELEDPITNVPWCSVDPFPLTEDKQREKEKFPLFFNGPKPFEVSVKAGQMLYL